MRAELPTVTIVGRPNVGKSTLFNRMAGARKSIVADEPNATRDWLETLCRQGDQAFNLIDTAGVFQPGNAEYSESLRDRTETILGLSDLVLFVVDAREGLHAIDGEIAGWLRRLRGDAAVLLVVNKSEGRDAADAGLEFHALGFEEMACISALRGDNLNALKQRVAGRLCAAPAAAEETRENRGLLLALAGRPNVGKSSLANALLGAQRVLVSDRAGTTRDCVEATFISGGKNYAISDTAGLRRRGKTGPQLEKDSNSRAIDAVKRSDVVLWMLDATEPISSQDKAIMRLILDVGRALVVVVNKWDLIDPRDRRRARKKFARELEAFTSAPIVPVSAVAKNFRAGPLLSKVDQAYEEATRSFTTRQLMAALKRVVGRKAPPLAGRIRPQLRYAHQGGKNPLLIVIHGNSLDNIGGDYQRYLIHAFSRELGLQAVVPHILFKLSSNPYV